MCGVSVCPSLQTETCHGGPALGCFTRNNHSSEYPQRPASAFRTAYLNEQWCLHGTRCFASQVRVQAATSLPVGLKARVPERLGPMSSCPPAHPTAHGILSTSDPDTVSWTCTSSLRVSCCRCQPKRRVLSSDFSSHSPEAEQSRERSHEAALAQCAEGFGTDNRLQSGGPEAVHHNNGGAPEASRRREENTTICLLKGPSAYICSSVTLTRGHTAHVMHYRWQLSAIIVPTRKLVQGALLLCTCIGLFPALGVCDRVVALCPAYGRSLAAMGTVAHQNSMCATTSHPIQIEANRAFIRTKEFVYIAASLARCLGRCTVSQ